MILRLLTIYMYTSIEKTRSGQHRSSVNLQNNLNLLDKMLLLAGVRRDHPLQPLEYATLN